MDYGGRASPDRLALVARAEKGRSSAMMPLELVEAKGLIKGLWGYIPDGEIRVVKETLSVTTGDMRNVPHRGPECNMGIRVIGVSYKLNQWHCSCNFKPVDVFKITIRHAIRETIKTGVPMVVKL